MQRWRNKMEISSINKNLFSGALGEPGLFPHLEQLKESPYRFKMYFGLDELPREPGILLIRGPRQYGKSTWLEQAIKDTIQYFGPGTAYYLNGDYLADIEQLEHEIELLLPAFSKQAPVKRIFIDEITSLSNWELCLKRLADQGKLNDILIITTGSKATDLRRASERLPGRKGKLARSTYFFTPVSYKEFQQQCGQDLGKATLIAYLLSGGSPIACGLLASQKTIPEYVIELTRDWIEGEIARAGRSRVSLLNIVNTIFRYGGCSVGQAKLAREAGLANNTVAAAYIELLNDLGCIIPSYPWDPQKKIFILRKPCKYHFTNLLVAVAYSSHRLRSVDDFLQLSPQEQGKWYEWLVSQELLRRAAIMDQEMLMPQAFWQTKDNEIDFVPAQGPWIEVKRGACSPLEFAWFNRVVPHQNLNIINQNSFETDYLRGITLEEFLLDYS
jgi:predicted AAA+ superfamily ATPase